MRSSIKDYLFVEASTHAIMEHQRKRLREKADHLSPSALANIEPLAAELGKEFSIDIPILGEAEIHSYPPREVRVDVSNDPLRRIPLRGQPFYQTGTEIKIGVPFTGDAAMFRFRPMQFTSVFPRGEIRGTELIFTKIGVNLDPATVRSEFDEWLRDVKQYLNWHRSSLGNFNTDIVSFARTEIQRRLTMLRSAQSVVNGLGFPVRN